jgi:glycosyltransferase involved in cell wall biosynthesis
VTSRGRHESSAGAAAGTAPPRVTVAVSTWNRAHLVGRAIASILAQTFADFEVLVVDDGSTDHTPGVLAGIGDPRLRIIRLDPNGGISRARNAALATARGEWLAFLDDDNEWEPEYLARQLALAESHPHAGVVYCRARRRDVRTGRDMAVPEAVWQGPVFRRLVAGWMPLVSCTLVRRAALADAGGFDESLRASEDRDMWLRLARRTDFAGTTAVLVARHEHRGAQLSRNYPLLLRDAAVLDRTWKAAIVATCGRLAYLRWRTSLVAIAEIARALRGVEDGRPMEAVRSAARLARHLPWSAPGIARVAVMAAFGLRAYGRLARLGSALRADMNTIAGRRPRAVTPPAAARPDSRPRPGGRADSRRRGR